MDTRSPIRKLALFAVLALVFITVAQAQAQGQGAPRRFAILIGINQYADSGLVQLQKAQNDAEDLGAALSRLGGFRAVTVMSGGKGYADPDFPSKNKIQDRVRSLADILRPDDQVLFFFSGHGVNDKSGSSYLLPIDAQIKDPTGTGISLANDIEGPLLQAGLKNLVVLIDACQKTVAKDEGLAVVGINSVNQVGSAVVITSTGAGKASFEDPKGANGLFTRSILAALGGEGDLNRDGELSVVELERYLPDAVAEYAFSAGLSQKPAVFDSGTGLLQPALAKLAVSPATSAGQASGVTVGGAVPTSAQIPQASAKAQFVQFKLPDGLKADIRVLSSEGRELKTYSDSPSFSDKLEPGSYRVEAQDRSYLYYPYSASFTVSASKTVVSLDLKPNFGSLSVSCDPADGVDILLNGEKRGSLSGSALSIDRLKSGSYELVASKELYDTKRISVQIEDGKANQVRISLSPNFYTLSVSAEAGLVATLYVDGQSRGSLPQTMKLPFRATALRVVAADSRYKEWTDTVQPAAKGSTEKRQANLQGRKGSLEVTTDPDCDATLSLTSAGPGQSIQIGQAPLDYEALIGEYSLSAEAMVGGKKLSGTVAVSLREGQTSTLKLQLKETQVISSGFVLVPGGTFTMGSPTSESGRNDDEVQHQVTLSSFAIAKYDLTFDEYDAYCQAMGVAKPSDSRWGRGSRPVINVSWYGAVAYCNWRSLQEGKTPVYSTSGTSVSCDFKANGYRLPTEAEWEYAAKGGPQALSLAANAVYAGSSNLDQVAWYKGNSGRQTHPVGQKAPTSLGLYDMVGNVWQWCWDWYGSNSAGSQSDPTGASSGVTRVNRGGNYYSVAGGLRSAGRGYAGPGIQNFDLGFRLACRP